MYVPTVYEINATALMDFGIRYLLLDLDNTIIPRDETVFSSSMLDWFKTMQKHGFKLCVVSNNGKKRVTTLLDPLDIPCVVRAVKPLRRAFIQGMKLIDAKRTETAVVGDQIFTDILGGNMLGLYTIMVVPMSGQEFWGTNLINRRLEKPIIKRLENIVSHEQKKYHVW